MPRSVLAALLLVLCLVTATVASYLLPTPAVVDETKRPEVTLDGSLIAGPPKVKLAVLVVFDQMRGDYIVKWKQYFPPGGFQRLMEDGCWFSECYHLYATTTTGPGHAAIPAGTSQAFTGIIDNAWYDRGAGQVVNCATSDRYDIVFSGSIPGRTAKHQGLRRSEGAGTPDRVMAPSVGDNVKASGRGGKVIGLSIKDRSAMFLSGHHADAAYWFGAEFVSSTYYMDVLPLWVRQFNERKLPNQWYGKFWKRSRPDLDYNSIVGPDYQLGEAERAHIGITFPHPLTGGESEAKGKYYEAIVTSPYGNELLLTFAKRCIDAEQLGQRDAADLLTISFSCNDVVGHAFGPDSQEVFDITLCSDRIMADLLATLDAKVGAGNYVVIVTADHGICPLPEVSTARGIPAQALDSGKVVEMAEKFLDKKYGTPIGPRVTVDATKTSSGRFNRWIEADTMPWVYLNYRQIDARKLDRNEVCESVATELRRHPDLYRVYTARQLAEQEPTDVIDRLVKASYYPGRSGDLYLLPKPYHFFHGGYTGTTHGSPFEYDRHVPLVVYGPNLPKGRQTELVAPQQAAIILADYLGVKPPRDAIVTMPKSIAR